MRAVSESLHVMAEFLWVTFGASGCLVLVFGRDIKGSYETYNNTRITAPHLSFREF